MISIVNRTAFTTTLEAPSPLTVTIPSTTAGNTLLIVSATPGIQAAAAPALGSQLLGQAVGRWGSGIAILTNVDGGQTTLTWEATDVIPSAGVVYELSPCTSADETSLSVTPSNSETGCTLDQATNSAYFEVIAQNATSGSYNSVNSPWTMDMNVSPLPATGASMGAAVYILNITGSETPTWSVTNGSTFCGVSAIALADSNPPQYGIIVETQIDAYPAQSTLAGTFIRFRLRNFAGTVPTFSLAPVAITATCAAGSISQNIIPNSGISPTGTFYTVEQWSNGRITSSNNFIITAAGDLSTMTPIPSASDI
jgi:hypothetical protein